MNKLLIIIVVLILPFISCKNAKDESRKELNLGIREMQNSKFESASEHFDKAIELNEQSAEAYLQRARLNLNMQNWELVTEDLNKAIELNPNYGEAFKSRALFRMKRGDKDGACEDFKHASELGVPNLYNYLSKCN